MNKLLEVREFDNIICESDIPTYIDNARYKPVSKKYFDELKAFIREYEKFNADDTDVLDFMRLSYSRNLGDIITVKNYVGVVQLPSGFQLQILPKVSMSSGDDANVDDTKRIFCRMLRSLKEFSGNSFAAASLNIDRMNLYDIFISMYIQEVRQLVKRGLKSAYISEEDNLRFYKGKLQISQHIKYNFVHKERFYVKYDEFSQNRAENRLIKATLLKLRNKTNYNKNIKEINQLLMSFENVDISTNYDKDFSSVVEDRNTKDYAQALRWSRIFLYDESFTTFAGKDNSKALLFPMEQVFENYVAKQVSKAFSSLGWEVSVQDKRHYLFDEPYKVFSLRPDIVMQKDERIVIMDTKWKRLTDNVRKHYGISQADMYQMYAYAKKYNSKEIYLLYPLGDISMLEKKIRFSSNESDGNISVNVFFVDLADMNNNMELLVQRIDN